MLPFVFHIEKQSILVCSHSIKGDDAFTSTGFKNWKNAVSRFKKHENSESHREATRKYAGALKSPSVSTSISNDVVKEQSI